jgi:TolB protein
MDWHFFGVRRHDAALRSKERGFYETSALLNNKAASCRRTPKKAPNRCPPSGGEINPLKRELRTGLAHHSKQRVMEKLPGVCACAALVLFGLMVAGLQSSGAAAAALGGDQPIIIKRTTREASRIAVPTFDAPPSGATLKQNNFHEIIYNDLEMTGYFQRGKNQAFIEETHQRDVKTGNVDFAEWKRLDSDFLLAGKCEITGETITATCILYYVSTGRRIFGKQFVNTVDQQRLLAHRISDEIFDYLSGGEKGIATTKILYVSSNDVRRQIREVWAMDADGENARQLTNDSSLAATPCWGANATEVYYTSYRDYNPDLCGIYLKGGLSWFISRYPGLNVSPSWSQTRQRIALTLGKDGNSEVYLMDRDGKNLKRLTFSRAIDSSPQWSPSGDDIAFTSDELGTGSPQIYIMDAEGGNRRRISNVGSSYCDGAAWSPKGDKIAFTARVNGQFEIYVCEVDGSNAKRLTSGQGNNEDPSWAPNGLMLTFTSDRTGSSHVYVMCNDGTNQRQLTKRGYNISPAWSPYLYVKPK